MNRQEKEELWWAQANKEPNAPKAILKFASLYLDEEERIHGENKYEGEVNRDMYHINFNQCNFYDEKAERKCLAYDYEDCNNTRAHKCKYAKMQAMEKHEGIATEIEFRWHQKGQYGEINFNDRYLTHARLRLDMTKPEFDYMVHLIKEKGILTDEHGQPMNSKLKTFYYHDKI